LINELRSAALDR